MGRIVGMPSSFGGMEYYDESGNMIGESCMGFFGDDADPSNLKLMDADQCDTNDNRNEERVI